MRIGDLGFESRLHPSLPVAYCALTDRCGSEGVVAAQAAIELLPLLPCCDGLATPYLETGEAAQAARFAQNGHAVCESNGVTPDSLVIVPFLDKDPRARCGPGPRGARSPAKVTHIRHPR